MTPVLAAVDDTTSAVAVVHAARAIAELLDASVRAIHVREDPDAADARLTSLLTVLRMFLMQGEESGMDISTSTRTA